MRRKRRGRHASKPLLQSRDRTCTALLPRGTRRAPSSVLGRAGLQDRGQSSRRGTRSLHRSGTRRWGCSGHGLSNGTGTVPPLPKTALRRTPRGRARRPVALSSRCAAGVLYFDCLLYRFQIKSKKKLKLFVSLFTRTAVTGQMLSTHFKRGGFMRPKTTDAAKSRILL